MTKQSEIVFAGWLKLSAAERQEVEAEIRNFKNSSTQQQINKSLDFSESVRQAVRLGPIQGGCPCCGR